MLTRMGVACLDASFAVSAMRARECRWYSALSIIAPPVNVLRRTRRKPSTIKGAAPDVIIGQSTAARAGARPYHTYAQIAQERVPSVTSHQPLPAAAYNLRGREERIKMRAHTDDSDVSKNSSTQDRPVIG
jgi:hypothetical protein